MSSKPNAPWLSPPVVLMAKASELVLVSGGMPTGRLSSDTVGGSGVISPMSSKIGVRGSAVMNSGVASRVGAVVGGRVLVGVGVGEGACAVCVS